MTKAVVYKLKILIISLKIVNIQQLLQQRTVVLMIIATSKALHLRWFTKKPPLTFCIISNFLNVACQTFLICKIATYALLKWPKLGWFSTYWLNSKAWMQLMPSTIYLPLTTKYCMKIIPNRSSQSLEKMVILAKRIGPY